MLKVNKIYFTNPERLDPKLGTRHEHEAAKGIDMRFDPELGLLSVRMGSMIRFYSASAYRFVECEEVKEGKGK